MPKEALILLIVFAVLMIPAVIVSIIIFRNKKQHLVKNLKQHSIEIITGFRFAKLVIDNKVVDEFRFPVCKLQGKVDGMQVIANVGYGFMKPKIITYINEEKDDQLSNC